MNQNVLLVDDEPHVLSGLSRRLRARPYCLLTAQSSQDAMQIMRTHPVDVVVSDEKMPGIPGLELLNWVSENFPDAGRILLTGRADMDMAFRVMDMDCSFRFITKGKGTDELIEAIEESLERTASTDSAL